MNSILTIKNNESHFIIQFLTKRGFKTFYFQTKITAPPQKKFSFPSLLGVADQFYLKRKNNLSVCVCVKSGRAWLGHEEYISIFFNLSNRNQ